MGEFGGKDDEGQNLPFSICVNMSMSHCHTPCRLAQKVQMLQIHDYYSITF